MCVRLVTDKWAWLIFYCWLVHTVACCSSYKVKIIYTVECRKMEIEPCVEGTTS